MNEINKFNGEYSFLSNFYPSPIWGYPTVENAFQAAKTEDLTLRAPFKTCTPGQAKRMGRKLHLRPGWDQMRDTIMVMCLREKFFPHTELAFKLLGTGDALLVEGNTWGDTYWGVCDGVGQNKLGQLLMEVRFDVRVEHTNFGEF